VAAVLGDTEDRWREIFEQNGQTYRPPKLRLFSGADASACGFAQAVMGPFYCPNDQHVYLDTSFFQDLQTRSHGCSGKACEFAEAYVIAHEVGHHVQNLLGILPKARRLQTESDRRSANHLQVQIELQADCLAGVWAHHSQQKWKFIEPGDVEAAMQRRDTRREGRKDKGVAVVDYALDNRPSTGGSGRSAVSTTRHAPVGSCHRRGAVEAEAGVARSGSHLPGT